jgi:transitional endoplasmic reticulum ATPase
MTEDSKTKKTPLTIVETREKVIALEDRIQHTGFNQIAGMEELKKTLTLKIIEPFRNPEIFKKYGKKAGGGVLLYGPPGCGKTMMARAVSQECKAQFIVVGVSDVLNMWRGESERNIANFFERARADRPAVLFFDELDALAFSRSKASSESSRTIVNEMLAQLDGLQGDNDQVLIMAATNMPWDVDPAMKRPGRFATQVFVPPPDALARVAILKLKLAGLPYSPDLNFESLARHMQRFSGADIDGVIEQVKERAINYYMENGKERPMNQSDFQAVLSKTKATTTDWLNTAKNLVKYAGADDGYKDVEQYLRSEMIL